MGAVMQRPASAKGRSSAIHARVGDSDRTDAQLVEAIAKNRDQVAFAELLKRHERCLYGLALRITGGAERAEETVHEAMVRVWTSAHSFRGEGEVRAWLFSI